MHIILRKAGLELKTDTRTHTRIVRQTPVQTQSVNEPSLSLPLLHTVSTYVHTVCVACGYLCCVCRSECVWALFIAAQPARASPSVSASVRRD